MAPTAQTPGARLAVLDAIRRGAETVVALAADLRVTDNAVRLHLSALERDGLVERRGLVRSGKPGQPAAEFTLTDAGETTLSAAYPRAFVALVESLAGRMDARALRAALSDAGARLAGSTDDAGTLAQRAERGAALLRSLGGSVQLRAGRGEVTLIGAGCPLAGAVRKSPATCTLIESLIERACGVDADQQCEHGERPSCRFRLTA